MLTGLVDSARCPECGKSIVEVLRRRSAAAPLGRRYESSTRIFGWPLLSIATGPVGEETKGHASGVFAYGDYASGVFALGGVARGVFAVGGVAIGVVAIGGISLGLLMSLAGLAAGGMVTGGVAVGVWVQGGVAIGIIADGGVALGWFARGGVAIGQHVMGGTGTTPSANAMLRQWGWLIGHQWPVVAKWSFLSSTILLLMSLVGVLAGYVFAGRDGDSD